MPALLTSKSSGPIGPSWVSDPSFDLRAHVRHATLPPPGGEAEVHEWLGDFWSHRLDRTRPLWEMTLVDGLEGDRWMLATKTHHAMVDGIGSVDIGQILLDVEPDPPRTAPEPIKADHGEVKHPQLPGWLSPVVGAAQIAIGTARHPSRLARAGEATLATGEMLWQTEIRATGLQRSTSRSAVPGGSRRCRSSWPR
jgi:diacylglycerol O-acyltransferase / wax synthase